MAAIESPAPVEPVLPMADIQGIVVPGFFKPHQTLIGIRLVGGNKQVAEFRKLLRKLTVEISTAENALSDRREFRARRKQKAEGQAPRPPLVGIGFTYQGLIKLTPGAAYIPSVAYREGLPKRSALLGDPLEVDNPGHPGKWVVGAPGNELDALIVVAGDTRDVTTVKANDIAQELNAIGIQIAYREDGDIREDLPGHEHFGFDDGVSQPGIRGRASDAPDDFITERTIAKSQSPETALFGYPGQDLVWPGEFVLGQPSTSPDPLIPGIPSTTTPNWTVNGSFLVFRRLQQDVALFWNTVKSIQSTLVGRAGFGGLTDDTALASRIVGRWPSGAPVNRTPSADDAALGKEPLANNHFRFDSDASPFDMGNGFVDGFAMSKADPAGITCPWAAHIRKVNTRDSGSDMGGRDSTYQRRLLRVGVPYGRPLADRYNGLDDPENGNRGLLFLSIQTSIEDQFEFLVSRWVNDPTRPKMPGGRDILLGQNNHTGEAGTRECVLFGAGLQQANLQTNAQWITPTGGGYFFIPSLTALRNVLAPEG